MKKIRILGIVVAIIAALVLVVGIYANNAKDGSGSFAKTLSGARETVIAMDDAQKAVRNSDSVAKRAESAPGKITGAADDVATAVSDIEALDAALVEGVTGDEELDALLATLEKMDPAAEGYAEIRAIADARILAMYCGYVSDAYDGVSGAEEAIIGVRDGVIKVYDLAGVEGTAIDEITATEEPVCTTIDECRDAVADLGLRAEELAAYEELIPVWAGYAADAAKIAAGYRLTFSQRIVLLLAPREPLANLTFSTP